MYLISTELYALLVEEQIRLKEAKRLSIPILTKTFLASLSDTKVEPSTHPHAVKYLESYDEFKEELMHILFKIYNSEIFGGHLPYNMKLFWSKTLFKTAGKCYCKNEGLYILTT